LAGKPCPCPSTSTSVKPPSGRSTNSTVSPLSRAA
jgi:hypothetical protein